MIPMICVLAATVLQATPPTSTTPNALHQPYFLGGALITVQPAGDVERRTSPALSGHGVGVLAAGGYRFTPGFALEGELNVGADIKTEQHWSYGDSSRVYLRHNRDMTLAVHARLSGGPIDVLAGVGNTWTRVGSSETKWTHYGILGTTVSNEADLFHTERALAIGYGIDVPVPRRARVQFVPAFRAWIINRHSSSVDNVGASRNVYQFGVTLRVGL